MTVAELIADLQHKPSTYQVRKAGEADTAVHETITDHETQTVKLW